MANLTQLKMLEDLNAFLLVDKPVGLAFSSIVKTIKRKFNLVKVGHGGSLDAMASGLMVILINDANKFVDQVMGADRAYSGTLRLGLKTDTHDVHGHVLSTSSEADLAPDRTRFESVINEFKGDIFQTEPSFSTIRKEGTADYEIADTGSHNQFLTHVYRFQTKAFDGDRVSFEVTGTKSLLVRTLVNDIGEAYGTGAALETLRRTKVGKFTLDKAITFDRLLSLEMKDFASCVIPMSSALL